MDDRIKDVGYLLNQAYRLLKGELQNGLKKYDLTPAQWGVIKDIACYSNTRDKEQELTPAAIAQRLHADRPTISGIIYRLSQRNWVKAIENPKDRRSQIIILTDKAKSILPEVEGLNDYVMSQAIKDFDEKELEELKSLLQRMSNNLC